MKSLESKGNTNQTIQAAAHRNMGRSSGGFYLKDNRPKSVLQRKEKQGTALPIRQLKENIAQRHPLASDDATYNIEILDALQELKEDASLRELVLQESPEAIQVMDDFIAQRGETGAADATMLRSILATIELHTSGVWHETVIKGRDLTDEERKVLDVMQNAYEEKDHIAEAYGLSREELLSIGNYTQPGKNKEDSPSYMGPDAEKWTEHENGWETLRVALAKLPSLQDLGLEITTYRAIRTNDSTRKRVTGKGLDPTAEHLSKLPPETNILHGRDPIPPFNQQHYTSTGITYTTAHMTDDRAGQGLIAMTGRSGKYIGPLGLAYWAHDAGEILYPPEMYSKFEGTAPSGWQDEETVLPVHHLREVDHPEYQQGIVEDHNFETVRERDPGLDMRKMELIQQIDQMVGNNAQKISMARAQADVHGPMMYLSIDELLRLIENLGPEGEVESLNADKLKLIQEIETLYDPENPEAFEQARMDSEVHGDMRYLSIPELLRLKTALEA